MIENRSLNLFEYQRSEKIADIDLADFEKFLNEIWDNRPTDGFFYGNDAEKEKKSKGQRFFKLNYDGTITPRNYTGVVIYKDFTFNVFPKVFCESDKNLFADNLLYWLSYIDRFKFPKFEADQQKKDSNILDIFIWLFANYTLETLNSSPYQQYEEVTEETSAIKGKLEFGDYIKNIVKGLWHKPVCRYSSFEYDNIFNRVVKATAKMLLGVTQSDVNRKTLSEIMFLLDDVTDICATSSDCDKIILNPMFSQLKTIVEYCRLFLSSAVHATDSGKLSLFAFLIPMEKIYEEFLLGFIKEHVNSNAGAKNGYLCENNEYQIKKDIEITDKCIIDAKYKLPEDKKPAQSDIYQMVSYAIRSKTPDIFLIYPEKNEEWKKTYQIKDEFSEQIISITAATIPFVKPKNETNENHDEILKKRFSDLLH
jgi:5-methylcytosine-specific restriction enzyme subunit McrC